MSLLWGAYETSSEDDEDKGKDKEKKKPDKRDKKKKKKKKKTDKKAKRKRESDEDEEDKPATGGSVFLPSAADLLAGNSSVGVPSFLAKKKEVEIEAFNKTEEKVAKDNVQLTENKKKHEELERALALQELQKKDASKEVMTFKQREGRKRARGQTGGQAGYSGSYVENEKRLLREAAAGAKE